MVSILLKTAGSDKDETVSARFIHQATVRREVVIELIEEMKRRGHSAYKHVDMDAVRERAKGLPEDDVPPEIIRLLPLDGAHDKLQPNKNATPVSGEGSLDDVRKNLEVLRYNAVVNERSSLDEGDEPAQVRACVEHTVRKLHQAVDGADDADDKLEEVVADPKNEGGASTDNLMTERIGMKTGHLMIDQFESFYFGTAFAFIFSYYCGFPDMPAFARKTRFRRPVDAPRIETAEWVRAMSRRIEASLARDYSFGFVTWNYLFRSSLNLSQSLYAYERRTTKTLVRSLRRKISRKAL